jgi:transcriptional regulator GlxA family with amidase domain
MPANLKALQIGIDADHFESLAHSVAPGYRGFDRGTRMIATTPGILHKLGIGISLALHEPSRRQANREETLSNLLAEFIATASDHESPSINCELHRAPAKRALDKAREFIDGHLEKSIRVGALCRYANANLRSLERVFAREIGLSPQQYIKIRRLNAAYRDLLASNPNEGHSVTEIALAHGFSHFGRFSGDYHRHFGEYPSETLKRH